LKNILFFDRAPHGGIFYVAAMSQGLSLILKGFYCIRAS
jgi:hypothetical protein